MVELFNIMTVDGIMTITTYKNDSFGLTTTFYNGKEEAFCVKSDNPLARIKHILPVKINYVFDGKNTRITGILPF